MLTDAGLQDFPTPREWNTQNVYIFAVYEIAMHIFLMVYVNPSIISRRQNKEPPWWLHSQRTAILKTEPGLEHGHAQKGEKLPCFQHKIWGWSWHWLLRLMIPVSYMTLKVPEPPCFLSTLHHAPTGMMPLTFLYVLSLNSFKQSSAVDANVKHSKSTGINSIWMSILEQE